jgi:hypothetical protein
VAIFVGKRIPINFLINIILYTIAIIFRAANELYYNRVDGPIRIIINGICVGLIELSL